MDNTKGIDGAYQVEDNNSSSENEDNMSTLEAFIRRIVKLGKTSVRGEVEAEEEEEEEGVQP